MTSDSPAHSDLWMRLGSAPHLEPPYDDEPTPCARTSTTARAAAPAPERPAKPGASSGSGAADEPAPVTVPAVSPLTRQTAVQVMTAFCEVLAYRRPVQQLAGWTEQAVYRQVRQLAKPGPAAVSLRTVWVSEPATGVAEVSAVLAQDDRVLAAAARIEARSGRWLCTYLHIL